MMEVEQIPADLSAEDKRNNSLPNPFDESDHFISGSLQNRLGHRCYVFGTENNISIKFTGYQGNNAFGIENNCGIACVTQLLILSGKRIKKP